MGPRATGVALVLAFVLPACAQGSNSGGATFGNPFTGSSPTDDDDGSATGDDDGESTAAGSGGEGSGGGTTGGPADSSADGTTESTGAPVTASAESTSDGEAESSSDGAETTTSDETTGGGVVDADPWESCAAANCVAGSDCINVTGLRDYSPYCAPECVVDADCPDPGGTAQVLCILVEEGAVDPTNCAVICSIDNVVQGNCPAGMDCADVPGQMTQVSVCMWP